MGTGMALSVYPRHCQVTGVDLAPDMLEHAQERIERNGWRHVQVMEVDAMDLSQPDNSFDYVTAFHVVSVVPDARRMMAEVQRVCKPNGTIVVINHFRSDKRALAAMDRRLEPITRRWGWHTLGREEVFDGSADDARAGLQDVALLAVHDRGGAQPEGCAGRDQCRDLTSGAYGTMPRRRSHWASRAPRVRSQRV